MSKENKAMLQRGEKQRAGKLLTSYLRAIGQEMTEVATVFTDSDTGKTKIISKAEALARDIWRKALPPKDEIGTLLNAKEVLEYRKLIIDRTDGKPGANEDKGDHPGASVPDRVSKLNKDRMNQMAKEAAEG